MPSKPPFTPAAILEEAFAWYRQQGFPYRRLPKHVCMAELNKLAALHGTALLRTTLGYQVADTYHPHRFHGHATGKHSPYTAFHDDHLLRRCLRLSIEAGGSLQGYPGSLSLVSGTQANSNFRPGVACYLYRKFCQPGATVLDTSMGYGGRLVGFLASGIAGRYIGIDPSAASCAGNQRLVDELGFASVLEMYQSPAENLLPSHLADRCDFAFTSPPYFAKEVYSASPSQSRLAYPTAQAWQANFLCPLLVLSATAVKSGCYVVINIADVNLNAHGRSSSKEHVPLMRWTIQAATRAGLVHEQTEHLQLTHRFGANVASPDGKAATEPILIFRKP